MSLANKLRERALRRIMKLPKSMLRKLAGPKVVLDGNTLDTQTQLLLTIARLLGIRDSDDVEKSRRAMDQDTPSVSPKFIAQRKERDLFVDGASGKRAARLYVPVTAKSTPPLLVFFHGGGFAVGSIRSHDLAVRELAHESGCAILSVDYRLAPEHKAPTAPDDGLAAYLWARAHAEDLGIDGEHIGVGGDSAGGNLAAVISHFCLERGHRLPDAQILIYPATDLTCAMTSHRTFARGFLLEEERVQWYLGQYLNFADEKREPYVSPHFYERFDGLPPTMLVTAGFDVLRDEGMAYAEKLRAAGVPVTSRIEPGLIHGFFNMSGVIDAARAADLRIAADTKRLLEASAS
jgi:acetyl esterase